MADIVEVNEFTESVYLIDTNDDVVGGEDGIDNMPHKALANRTRYLKDKLESLPVLKNLIINGDRAINVRGLTGTNLNTYYEDRWRGNGAGGLLQIIIPALVMATGNYTLSWSGTAKATISESADNTSYSELATDVSTGITVSVTKNTYIKVEFDSTDFTDVQFEPGEVATPYAKRWPLFEKWLCRHFTYILDRAGGGNFQISSYTESTVINTVFPIIFPIEMIRTPSLIKEGTWAETNISAWIVVNPSPKGFVFSIDAAAAGTFTLRTNDDTDRIICDAEIY